MPIPQWTSNPAARADDQNGRSPTDHARTLEVIYIDWRLSILNYSTNRERPAAQPQNQRQFPYFAQ